MKPDKLPEDKTYEEKINQMREAYTNTVEEQTGIVNQIITMIKGGTLSKDGMLLMEMDAERENEYRDKKGTNEFRDQELKKLQKSYLYCEAGNNPDYFPEDQPNTISGIINGNNVSIKYTTRRPKKKMVGVMNNVVLSSDKYTGQISYSGTINGEQISEELARKIYDAYIDVAHIQGEHVREMDNVRRDIKEKATLAKQEAELVEEKIEKEKKEKEILNKLEE